MFTFPWLPPFAHGPPSSFRVLVRGGYVAPRAAAFEHRFAALIVDPGQFDLFDMAMARVLHGMREAIERNDPGVDSALDKIMQDDTRRFFVAARMRAFGAKTLKEFLLMQREYSLKGGLAEKIECPTLVCDNVADVIAGGQAKELYEALRSPRDYVLFTAEEGAAGHCEGGAQGLFNSRAFDWLGKTLG